MDDDTNSEAIRNLIRQGQGHVHLAGICGIGMAGLALHLKKRGLTVSGCDARLNPLAEWLVAHMISVVAGHDAAHIDPSVTCVIRSAAVPSDSPEIAVAAARHLPVFKRGEVLPILLDGMRSVAVGGTHGKTTTTSFVVQVLRAGGHDPGFCIGGEVPALGGVAAIGRDATLVVEADESDGTLALYAPDFGVITNIEFDHMEHFADVEAFEQCFRTFAAATRKRIIYGADDPRAASIGRAAANGLSFGLSDGCDLQAVEVRLKADRSHYQLVRHGRRVGHVDLPVPGIHNVLNSLAAAAVGFEFGMAFDQISAGLGAVQLPRRRFERVITRPDFGVITDYAHHPSEVAALMRAAHRLDYERRRVLFQPHRYTRTRALGADFPAAFEYADEIVLAPVYAASEPPLEGGTTWDLYCHFRKQPDVKPLLAGSLNQAWDYWQATASSGDLLLVVGAGDVDKVAGWARAAWDGTTTARHSLPTVVRQAFESLELTSTVFASRESLAGRTTLRVGGAADMWAEIGGEEDLQKIAQWCGATSTPFRLMGAGSNLLVSDLGARGVVGRLAGIEFRRIVQKDGIINVGAGLTLAALLQWTTRHALEGIEFLEGIPGTVGGALRMNAGAWGGGIGDYVAWVRGLRPDGTLVRMEREELDFGYRVCPALTGCILVEAGLRLRAGEESQIKARRADYAGRRAWMRGLRSAGSIFKNPPGDHAGRLIEQAGFKGVRVGGAMVATQHANVITTDHGATASDVRALMELVRGGVRNRFAIELEAEVVCWE